MGKCLDYMVGGYVNVIVIFIFFGDCTELFVFLLLDDNLFCTWWSIFTSGGGTGKCTRLPGSSRIDREKAQVNGRVIMVSEE